MYSKSYKVYVYDLSAENLVLEESDEKCWNLLLLITDVGIYSETLEKICVRLLGALLKRKIYEAGDSICSFNLIAVWEKLLRYERDFICDFSFIFVGSERWAWRERLHWFPRSPWSWWSEGEKYLLLLSQMNMNKLGLSI